jgi:hypothetical protein
VVDITWRQALNLKSPFVLQVAAAHVGMYVPLVFMLFLLFAFRSVIILNFWIQLFWETLEILQIIFGVSKCYQHWELGSWDNMPHIAPSLELNLCNNSWSSLSLAQLPNSQTWLNGGNFWSPENIKCGVVVECRTRPRPLQGKERELNQIHIHWRG